VLADLDDVLEELPERLVVGTGAYGQSVRIRRHSTSFESVVSRWRRYRRTRRVVAMASSTLAGRRPLSI
jgi:hypothetical protein